MKTRTQSIFTKTNLRRGCVLVAALALLPHLGESIDYGSDTGTNTIGASSQLMVGNGNSGYGARSLLVGQNNTLGASSPYCNNLGVGTANLLSSYNSVGVGASNNLYNWYGAAFGQLNSVYGTSSMVAGIGNQSSSTANYSFAAGTYNITYANASVALGANLNAYSYASLAVGRYNKPVNVENTDTAARNTWREGDTLFVVGNGTGTAGTPTEKRNALLVTKDGTVTIGKVPPQGGIDMGVYTAQ